MSPFRSFTDLPTFLDEHFTAELAIKVVGKLRPLIESEMDPDQALAMNFALAQPDLGWPWINVIHVETFGQQPEGQWPYPYDAIAFGKNAMSGRTGQLSRVIQRWLRDRLIDTDTPYWGNWKMGLLLVSASGDESYNDEMYATMAGMMVFARLQHILKFAYGITAERAGLVTYDNTTIPVFSVPGSGDWDGPDYRKRDGDARATSLPDSCLSPAEITERQCRVERGGIA